MSIIIHPTAVSEFLPSDILGNGLLLLSGDPGNDADWAPLFAPPLNIRRVVRCLPDAPTRSSRLGGLRKPFHENFSIFHVPVEDKPSASIEQYFMDATKFIENGIAAGVRTLVHCGAGVSRSASIVIAYLVSQCNMTLAESLAKVQKARPVVNPNQGFLTQLMDFEVKVRGVSSSSVDADEYYLTKMEQRFGQRLSPNELRGIYFSDDCNKDHTKFKVTVMELLQRKARDAKHAFPKS